MSDRTAYHEAGHAVAMVVMFDTPPPLVSTRPGLSYDGVTVLPDVRGEWADSFDPSVPSLGQPHDLRTALERHIVVALAGDAAEAYALRQSGYSEPSDCATAALTAARSLAELHPRHRDLLALVEADRSDATDHTRAAELSWLLVGSHHEAAAHVQWLSVVARRLVSDHLQSIAALAAALAARTVMDGSAVMATIEAVRPGVVYAA